MTKNKFNFSRKIKPRDKKKDFSGYLHTSLNCLSKIIHTILVLIALVKLSVGTFTYGEVKRVFWGGNLIICPRGANKLSNYLVRAKICSGII